MLDEGYNCRVEESKYLSVFAAKRIYMSARYDSFLSSVGQITYVLAIAVASTIALHFDALRLPVRSSRIPSFFLTQI